MTDQLDTNGNVVPTTWDGEPLYHPETVREGLFDPEAFEQMPRQMAMDGPICKVCKAAPAEFPKYATPDMCQACSDAAWARIDAAQVGKPGIPGNDVTNVWD